MQMHIAGRGQAKLACGAILVWSPNPTEEEAMTDQKCIWEFAEFLEAV